jgi:enolase
MDDLMSTLIQHLYARRIWDSRGRPTVEAEVTLANGQTGRGLAPAGASRGSREATDLRDGGDWLGGYDVSQAVAQVNGPIAHRLKGRDAMDQAAIDQMLIDLDGTPTKSRLGGNASIAVSMAVLQAAAASTGQSLWQHLSQGRDVRLPLPEVQIFGGGAHAGRRVDIQDFLIMPIGAGSFDEALVMVARVYHAAGDIMQQRGRRAGVADEGGWWPDFSSNEEALETLVMAIEKSGLGFDQVAISLDIAASEFGRQGRYTLGLEQRSYDTDGWLEVLTSWVHKYPILSVEDPVAEDDTVGMQRFMQAVGQRIQVIGDDYLVTREELVRQAIADRACNAVLIKPNQVGTITEAHRAMMIAREAGWGQVVSARSGETEDTIIVHLATGWNTGQLKVGSFARSERMAKWNEGLRIESALGGRAVYAGASALPQGIHWAP